MFSSAIRIMNAGGTIMWAILAMSVISMGIAMEKFLSLRSRRREMERFDLVMRDVLEHLKLDRPEEAATLAPGESTPYRLVRELVALWDAGTEAMRDGATAFIRREVFSQQRGLGWLELSVKLSPMLGLLGTVMGMVQMFGSIGASGATSQGVASGIRVALFTTVAGLSCAIPSLLALTTLQNMIDSSEESLRQAAERLIMVKLKSSSPGLTRHMKANHPSAEVMER